MYKYVKEYQKFSQLVASFSNDQHAFSKICFDLLKNSKWIEYLNEFNEDGINYIDPLTLLCIINGHSPKQRFLLIKQFCQLCNCEEIIFDEDEKFEGVSVLNKNHRILLDYRNSHEALEQSSKILWNIFMLSIKKNKTLDDLNCLISLFDIMQTNVSRSWDRLAHALSYANPENYFALSSPNRNILLLEEYSGTKTANYCKSISLTKIKGRDYFKLCEILKTENMYHYLPKLSNKAYEIKNDFNVERNKYNLKN